MSSRFAGLVLSVAIIWACTGDSGFGFGGDNGGTGAGTTTHTGGGGTGGSLLEPTTSGMGGGTGGLDETCAGTSSKAQLTPLDVFIMMDQSGSMNDASGGGKSKWAAVIEAFKTFVASPTSSGMGVGIQYFPLLPDCGKDSDCGSMGLCYQGKCIFPGPKCTASTYAAPEVEIATLPGNGPAIVASLNAHNPVGGTPTAPALQGAIDHATAWANDHPTHATVVVLATDGAPMDCSPQDIPSIAKIATTGVNGSPKILTFVIGVGKELSSLNAIASAGGTGQAFIVDVNQSVADQFAKALAEIQSKALACEYLIPQPMQGALDFDKVNVSYKAGGSKDAKLLPQVAGPMSCSAAGGWYYVPTKNPTKIVMCPTTCSTFKADVSGEVDIVLGCKTILS